MTADPLGPDRLELDLRLRDHLPECGRGGAPWPDCEWCSWAASTPEVRFLADAAVDARALLADARRSVAWVVAAGELLDCIEAMRPEEALVPSVRALTTRLQAELRVPAGRLDAVLRAAVASGGPVEQRCLQTGGALAAAVAQDGTHDDVLARLAPAARSHFDELSSRLSARVQVEVLLPVVDHLHWQGLPTLRTQPAWDGRPARDGGALRARQLASTALLPGSLESLVVESLLDAITEDLIELGDELARAGGTVALARRAGEGKLSGRTRATMWRIARFDWHLTFVDTGRAECWGSRRDGDLFVTEVPWQVAAAIRAADAHGLVSATHRGLPGGPPRPGR